MNEESLFAAALEYPTPAERRAFLDRACGAGTALRERLERLLSASGRTRGILDTPAHEGDAATVIPLASVGDTATVDRPLDVPTRAGPPDATATALAGVVAPPGFAVEKELGAGGMGVVYLARQEGLNRLVALKTVRAGVKLDRKALIRFLAEAEAVAAVRHPNVVEVYGFGQEGGRPFMALEYCPGGDLTALARSEPRRDGKWFRRVAGLMADVGAAAAHAQGIVHRDLKPGNVLLAADGTPKVTDFGLAKRGTGSDLTRTQAVMGTPAYMSPEQAKGDTKFVGPEADVWALGVMLYEMCSGERPFDGAGAMEVLARVARADVPPLKSRCPEVPRDLALIASKCLSGDPRDRYPTAKEVSADLRNWLDSRPISARPAGVVESAVKWAKRNKRLAGMGLAVLLTMAVATAVSLGFGLDARVQAGIAQREKKNAEDAAELAKAETRRADDKTADAAREAKETQRLLDLARLREVATLLAGNRVGTARENLDAIAPENRCLVWGLLRRRLEGAFALRGHTAPVGRLEFSPDGTRVVSRAADGAIRLWDVATGRTLREVRPQDARNGSQGTFTLSPNGRRLVTLPGGGVARLWDTATGALVAELPHPDNPPPHPTYARSAEFTPDGSRVFTSDWSTSRLWDADTGNRIPSLDGTVVAMSPDGSRLVTTGPGGTHVCASADGRSIVVLKGHLHPVLAAAFSPDGSRVYTAEQLRPNVVIDPVNKNERLLAPGEKRQSTVPIRAWDAATGARLTELTSEWAVSRLAVSPDGTVLLTEGRNEPVQAWDLGTGRPKWSTPASRGAEAEPIEVENARFSPNGRWVVVDTLRARALDGVEVRDAATGAPMAAGAARDGTGERRIATVKFSPNGARMAVVIRSPVSPHGGGGQVWDWAEVWDGATGRPVVELHANEAIRVGTHDLLFTPDGRRVVTRGDGVRVWDAASGEQVRGPIPSMGSAARVSPDGRWLAVGDTDGTIQFHNLAGTALVMPLQGLAATREQADKMRFSPLVAFSPAADLVAYCTPTAADIAIGYWLREPAAALCGGGVGVQLPRLVRVCDVVSGRQVGEFPVGAGMLFGSAFRKDGAQFAALVQTISPQGRQPAILVWDVRTGQPVARIDTGNTFGPGVEFAPDGCITVRGLRGEVTWVVATGREKSRTPPAGPPGGRDDVPAYGGHKTMTLRYLSESLQVFDHSTGRTCCSILMSPEMIGTLPAVRFNTGGSRLAIPLADGSIRLFDAATGQLLVELPAVAGPISHLAFSADDSRLVGLTASGLLIWHTEGVGMRIGGPRKGDGLPQSEGRISTTPQQHQIQCVALSPDDSQLVTATTVSGDSAPPLKTLSIWDSKSGQLLRSMNWDNSATIQAIGFSQDGSRVIASDGGRWKQVWDTATGALVKGFGQETKENFVMGRRETADGRLAIIRAQEVEFVGARPNEQKVSERRVLLRPDPQYHAALRTRAEVQKDPFAAAAQHSLEHRARGLLAAEKFDAEGAFTHLLTAELLKPKPGQVVTKKAVPGTVPEPTPPK